MPTPHRAPPTLRPVRSRLKEMKQDLLVVVMVDRWFSSYRAKLHRWLLSYPLRWDKSVLPMSIILVTKSVLTNAELFSSLQNLLESKSLAGVSSVGPVMMVSVGASMEQSAKPSYKMVSSHINHPPYKCQHWNWQANGLNAEKDNQECLYLNVWYLMIGGGNSSWEAWTSLFSSVWQSVKTYTRRGRGRCLNPGCSFVYVTRHKPPTCPECGSHLGGKWIPAVSVKQYQGCWIFCEHPGVSDADIPISCFDLRFKSGNLAFVYISGKEDTREGSCIQATENWNQT